MTLTPYANPGPWEKHARRLEKLLPAGAEVCSTEFTNWHEPGSPRDGLDYHALTVRGYGWTEAELEARLEALGFESWGLDHDTDMRGPYAIANPDLATTSQWMARRLTAAERGNNATREG
jgi:hypothetical protein